jgi:hypothetical protein
MQLSSLLHHLARRRPNGHVGYVDSKSGAFIGDDLKSIKKDVAACEDVEVMKKQCKDAQKQAKTARLLNTDDFWGRLRWGVEPDEVIKVVQDDDFS